MLVRVVWGKLFHGKLAKAGLCVYGRQGLDWVLGPGYSVLIVSLRASGAQLGSEAIYMNNSQSIIIILTILIIMIC